MTNCDVNRIINSDEVQSVLNPRKEGQSRFVQHKNPLKNLHAMEKINPGAFRRHAINKKLADTNSSEYKALIAKRAKRVLLKKDTKKQGLKFFKALQQSYVVAEAPKV